jgi:SAM-dependent methyltransferase
MQFRGFEVVRCIKCGQRRTWPPPAQADLETLYGPENDHYSLAHANDPARIEAWAGFAAGILDELGPPPVGGGRLLDVGCNLGDLLHAAQARGWRADGLEINRTNADWLRRQGLKIYAEPLESARIESASYDVLVANQVLEHVFTPNDFLEQAFRVLRPGGLLFVGVPCFESPIPIALKRERWYAMLPEEHVWQFGEGSLSRLLDSRGFLVQRLIRGTSPFWDGPSLTPRSLLRSLVYRSVAVAGQGDFLNVVAERVAAPA